MLRDFLTQLIETGKFETFPASSSSYAEKIATEKILENMRIVAMENEAQTEIEEFLEEDFREIYKCLLTIGFAECVEEEADVEKKKLKLRRARLAMRFLVNLVQRSEKFASSISHESIDLIESLLVVGEFDKEILILLTKTADFGGYLEFQKSTRYSKLLEKVVDSFYKANQKGDSIENDALAYFSIIFEKDYAILANCYAEMKAQNFAKLLGIFEFLIEENCVNSKIHENNLLFCLNLLELICMDNQSYIKSQEKKYPKSVEERKMATVETIKLLVEIVGEMCSNTQMTSKLNEKATTICCIFDILDTILQTEAIFFEYRQNHEFPSENPPKDEKIRKALLEEKRIEEAKKKQPDRPDQPKPARLKRVEESETLSAISQVFLEFWKNVKDEDYGTIGEIKLNCLKAIANLCELSMENKLASCKNGRMGLLSILQCTTRRPIWFFESYAIQKWAIFCVRQLTEDCLENKEVILNLDQPAQPIMDRQKLLSQFGLKSVLEDEKFKLKPIQE